MPKQQKFYSDAASVPQKARADRSAASSPRLGTQVPTSIPKKPGRTKALVQPMRLKTSRHVKGSKRHG